jgi:hypothetical protein
LRRAAFPALRVRKNVETSGLNLLRVPPRFQKAT